MKTAKKSLRHSLKSYLGTPGLLSNIKELNLKMCLLLFCGNELIIMCATFILQLPHREVDDRLHPGMSPKQFTLKCPCQMAIQRVINAMYSAAFTFMYLFVYYVLYFYFWSADSSQRSIQYLKTTVK